MRVAITDLRQMIGKTVLVGINYLDSAEEIIEQIQFAGVVTSVDPLIAIECGEAEPFTLPPEADAFDAATPGEYRLRSTGEVVVDPDYVTSWTVTARTP
jgi:hypothetical protein